MGTEIKSHAKDVSLTRFWGGPQRGTCLQVGQKSNSVQLTRSQAQALALDLLMFAKKLEVEGDTEWNLRDAWVDA